MKYLPAALACALLAMPGTAMAATIAASSKDAKIYKTVTEDDLVAIVTAEGATVDELHPFEDYPSVRGKTADGLLYLLIGTACDEQAVKHCQGIMMQVRYDSDENVTLETVNKSNNDQAAVQTYWDQENKTVGFSRYVVLDDGVTWLNIRQNLRVLLVIQDEASSVVFQLDQ